MLKMCALLNHSINIVLQYSNSKHIRSYIKLSIVYYIIIYNKTLINLRLIINYIQ